jgi:hypothetical protein
METIQERFTAKTLIKWRPEELRRVTEFCHEYGVDRALLVRGAATAVALRPLEAIQFLKFLPAQLVERVTQAQLPFDAVTEARKPAKKVVRKAKGKKGGRRASSTS